MPAKSLNVGRGRDGPGIANMLREYFACGVLVVDAHGKVVGLTPETRDMLGLNTGPVRPLSLEKLPRSLQVIIQNAASERAPTETELVVTSARGEPVRISASVLPHAPGKPGGVTVLLKDLSSLRQLEVEMRRLDRLANVGTLSASMAHEIRNAHVAMRTFVDLLLENNRDAELAEIVRREMGRVDAILGQMLKFAAPAQPVLAPLHLHEVIEHSLRMVRHRIESKLISFRRELRATPDLLSGDSHQLEQAFVNLFLNAIEAIGANGTLTVTTELIAAVPNGALHEARPTARDLRITVADTGMGISPQNLGRIFEPFFTTKKSGTGLGLPVTVRIIQEHHGSIQVESAADQGTTVTVLLPLLAPPEH
jgi:two-component system, NtrC family, sensor histidine kinase HydH